MAKITNIKTRDGAVHPMALPFAVCSGTVSATTKTLTFSGGDTPTELVDGQQIMVQFPNGSQTASTLSVKITDGASITYTVPVVLNSSDTSIVPYIGEGAVVNLTYHGNKFYISNAAALTGFEVPTDITLATITNNGGIITALNNNATITKLDTSGSIEKINNTAGTIGVPDSLAEGIFNGAPATIYYVENSGKIVTFKNKGTTGDSGSTTTGIQNTGNLYNITNSSGGTIYQINNIADIKTITIGTDGSPNNLGKIGEIYNYAGGTVYVDNGIKTITNGGFIETFNNGGTTGKYNDTNTGIQNTGNLYNISNTGSGTIYQLNNMANIKTITIGTAETYTEPGLVDQITNWSGDVIASQTVDYTPTRGIDNFTNKGRIKTLETTGDIGFPGTLPACPTGYTSTNYYDANTGIKNKGIIHNIQNDVMGTTTHPAVIRHIANYGGNGIGGISLFENGGDLSYLVNVPAATGASDIPGGHIGKIINTNSIDEINNGKSTNRHGHIETINNWSAEGAGGGINNIYNQPGGVIDDIYNGEENYSVSTIHSISNWGVIGLNDGVNIYGIGNKGSILNIQNDGTINILHNNPGASIGTFVNKEGGHIASFINDVAAGSTSYIQTFENRGYIEKIKNPGKIDYIEGSGQISHIELSSTSKVTFENHGTLTILCDQNANINRIQGYLVTTSGQTYSYYRDNVIQSGQWKLDPFTTLTSIGAIYDLTSSGLYIKTASSSYGSSAYALVTGRNAGNTGTKSVAKYADDQNWRSLQNSDYWGFYNFASIDTSGTASTWLLLTASALANVESYNGITYYFGNEAGSSVSILVPWGHTKLIRFFKLNTSVYVYEEGFLKDTSH